MGRQGFFSSSFSKSNLEHMHASLFLGDFCPLSRHLFPVGFAIGKSMVNVLTVRA